MRNAAAFSPIYFMVIAMVRSQSRTVPPALEEAISVGLRQAEAALAAFVGVPARIEQRRIALMPVFDVPGVISDPDAMVVGSYITFEGGMSGHGMLLFAAPTAGWIAARITGTTPPASPSEDPLARSALEELGNVVVGNFINGIADSLGIAIMRCVPCFVADIAGAILNSVAAEICRDVDTAVVVDTEFHLGGPAKPETFSGHLILLPSGWAPPAPGTSDR